MLPSSDTTEVSHSKRPDGSEEAEETLEIWDTDASTLTLTQTTIMSNGTSAATESTTLGTLIEEVSDIQSSHLLLVSNSKSDQEWTGVEPSTEVNIWVDINTT